jgi:hypothetical protein
MSTFKPVVDFLHWTCDGLNSSALSMNIDDECFLKSDILALQRRLLEVIRSSYTDMLVKPRRVKCIKMLCATVLEVRLLPPSKNGIKPSCTLRSTPDYRRRSDALQTSK